MIFSSMTHQERFILIFCLIFYFIQPITYDEVKEHKLTRLQKHSIEVVNLSSQPFLSNIKSSTINDNLNSYNEYKNLIALKGHQNNIILVTKRKQFKKN